MFALSINTIIQRIKISACLQQFAVYAVAQVLLLFNFAGLGWQF